MFTLAYFRQIRCNKKFYKIYIIAPEKNPISASKLIFLKYQKKLILSMPIAATPAAEPIMSALPPVPAQYARNSQKKWSGGYCVKSYIPCAAATKGTLSITDDTNPIKITIMLSLPILAAINLARFVKIPVDCRAEIAIKIPRKNSIVEVSTFRSACTTEKLRLSSSSFEL